MNIFSTTNRVLFFLLICVCVIFSSATFASGPPTTTADSKTDDFDIKSESFLLPQALPKGKYSSSIFLLNVYIPSDWTLDVIKTPMIQYSGKYTLWNGLNIQASLATLIISYRGLIGPWWNYSVKNNHFGIGYQVAYNYGILNQFGYNTIITGVEQQPSIAYGHSFKKMAFTLRGDLYVTSSLNTTQGEHKIILPAGFVNGYSFTASLEQRLTKNRVLSFGFKWNYLRYHLVAWPAFPVNAYYYQVPETQIGYNF